MSTRRPLKRILEILTFERREISSIYFYAILAGLVQLTLPLGIQAIISFVLGGAISTSLVLLIIFVVFGVFISGLLQVNQMKIIEKIQQQLFVRYSFKYAHLLPNIDLKGVRDHYLPELVNRFFDVISLQKGISKLLLDVPTATIQILFGLILLSFYHPTFIFFGLLLVFILYLILRFTGDRGLETSMAESSNKYKVAGHLEQVASMASTFKFIDNAFQLRKADKHISNYLNSRTAHFKILLIQYWALIMFKLLITASMLIVGAVLLVNQQLNIGQFIAAEIVIILVINSVEKLIVNLDKVYDVLTSLEKINEVIEKPSELSGGLDKEINQKGLSIELKDVAFNFRGYNVLKDITFKLEAGEKLCLTGGHGCGKSTLLAVLGGIYRPENGQVLVGDIPLKNYDLQYLRQNIGVLFSGTDIISGSIMENITMGRDVSYQKVDSMAEVTGLKSFVNNLPEGYDKMLQQQGYHLPDGIIQKILLTRMLVTQPKLMLLDRPFNKVDVKIEEKVLTYLYNEMKDTTVIITGVTCERPQYFDKILELRKGRVEYFGDVNNDAR